MGQEIERKWLVPAFPEEAAAGSPAEEIDQGYLTIGSGGDETRLRARAGEYVLTTKSGTGLVRAETSIELTREQFDTLWPATDGQRITKTRHLIAGAGGFTIELDVYTGALAGLLVAEVEFPDETAAQAFAPPSWFGAEVTADSAYRNHALALHGRP